MNKRNINFEDYLSAQLKNATFKKQYEKCGKQLEIAYKILQLRKKAGISQIELANKIGTTQSNVARLETGSQNFTTGMLIKIATALNKDLKVEFV